MMLVITFKFVKKQKINIHFKNQSSILKLIWIYIKTKHFVISIKAKLKLYGSSHKEEQIKRWGRKINKFLQISTSSNNVL